MYSICISWIDDKSQRKWIRFELNFNDDNFYTRLEDFINKHINSQSDKYLNHWIWNIRVEVRDDEWRWME